MVSTCWIIPQQLMNSHCSRQHPWGWLHHSLTHCCMLLLLQIGLMLLLKDAAQGLLYLHRRNVVHGDFNVSVTVACQLDQLHSNMCML